MSSRDQAKLQEETDAWYNISNEDNYELLHFLQVSTNADLTGRAVVKREKIVALLEKNEY